VAGFGGRAVQVTLEQTCRRILGQANPLRTKGLTVGQVMEATIMLEEGWPAEVVARAVKICRSMGWFRVLGYSGPPWEVTPELWAELARRAPWEWPEENLSTSDDRAAAKAWKRESGFDQSGQLDLF